MKLLSALKHAIERHELFLSYQPIFDLTSQKIVGLEALIHWEHPTEGDISPGCFIPLAEKNHLIEPIGTWIIRTVCEQIKLWNLAGISGFTVSINLSPIQLLQENLIETIQDIIAGTQISAQTLIFEITETAMMPQNEEEFLIHLDKLKQIRDLGIGIYMDDFGTGYAFLSNLSRLPIQGFKIDKSFIHNIHPGSNNAIIVATLINLAKNLGFIVTAEGIEEEDQLQFLIRHRCPQGQGFYLSEPLHAEQVIDLLRKNNA